MHSRYLVRAIYILLFVVVIGTPLFYSIQSVYPYTFSKTLFFQAFVEVLFALWLALLVFEKRYRVKFTPILIALTAFLGVLLVTSFTGVDPWRSFWSTQERVIGVFTFLHFAALTLVLSSLRDVISWKKLFYASLGTAAVVSILGFLQFSNPSLLLNEPVGDRPGSTFGNPSFLAGYLLFHFFIALYFLFEERHSKKQNGMVSGHARSFHTFFFAATLLIITVGLFNTQTRGDILGLGAGIFSLLVLFSIAPPRVTYRFLRDRRVYTTILSALIVFGGVFWFSRHSAVWNPVPGLNRFRDVSLSDPSLLPRLGAIRSAWQGFLDRPLLGWGWENFNIVSNRYYDPRILSSSYQETRFDKPHNLFLEYLVTGGAPLLLAFLFLAGTFLYEAWRAGDPALRALAIAAFVAYLVRSAFIFDTIGPLLMLFLLFGVVDGAYRASLSPTAASPPSSHHHNAALLRRVLAWIFLCGALILVYVVNIQSFQATSHQYWGFIDFVRKKPQQAISEFHSALDIWSPYRWAFTRDYASVIAENYFYNPSSVPVDEVTRAVQAMEEIAAEHPQDAYNHYLLVDIYNQVSDIDVPRFTAAAEREAALALQLSPERQEVLFSLAKTKHIEGDDKAALALALVQRGIELNPQVPDAHFYYGVLSYENHDPVTGYAEIEKAIALGRGWKNYNEPRVIAGYFADNGHLDEAIELYKKALAMSSNDDTEAKVKLGAAYFFAHQPALAKQYLTEAITEFDITKSPSYASFKPIFDALNIRVPAPGAR